MTEAAAAEDFTAQKYSIQNATFRSIKRGRDLFLAEVDAQVVPEAERWALCTARLRSFLQSSRQAGVQGSGRIWLGQGHAAAIHKARKSR